MRIRIIDAFADRPFAGNPAAVCLLEDGDWPAETWMREVASEMNLPMTAFARPLPNDPDADWALRWFNAVIEADMCGHATLATVQALDEDGAIDGEVRFRTCSGILAARTDGDGVTLDLQAATLTPTSVPPELAAALGAEPDSACAAQPLRDVIAVFGDEQMVRDLSPDSAALAAFTTAANVRGVAATARASAADSDYDFVSRFFSPADGLPEDPVTGSAHTALAPYWAQLLGRNRLVGFQASARGGRVEAEVHRDRVELTGRAVTVLDGELTVAGRDRLRA